MLQNKIKSHEELMEEARREIQERGINPETNPVAFALFATTTAFMKLNAQNEGRKSPEQKARERQESALAQARRQQEKAAKESQRKRELYSKWCKRDTWRIDEALHLLMGRDPQDATIFDDFGKELIELIESCVGYSLTVISPKESRKQWRVVPTEWVRWAKQKDLPVPEELTDLLFPQLPNKPGIAKAQETREQKKRERQRFLKSFAFSIESKAREKNIPWESKAIPVTKDEFLDFFYSQYPQIGRISKFTFDHDIAEIGLKFKAGTKTNPNNPLVKILT